MCLGIPGQIIDITAPADRPDLRTGTVDFGGVRRSVCLAYAPEAGLGDYVIVHVGFAISVVDEAEAHRTLAVIRAIPDALSTELGPPGPGLTSAGSEATVTSREGPGTRAPAPAPAEQAPISRAVAS